MSPTAITVDEGVSACVVTDEIVEEHIARLVIGRLAASTTENEQSARVVEVVHLCDREIARVWVHGAGVGVWLRGLQREKRFRSPRVRIPRMHTFKAGKHSFRTVKRSSASHSASLHVRATLEFAYGMEAGVTATPSGAPPTVMVFLNIPPAGKSNVFASPPLPCSAVYTSWFDAEKAKSMG
jgi:hypothetical protein